MARKTIRDVTIRPAGVRDVDAIAEAHRDSIDSMGPVFYGPQDVAAWRQGLAGQLYRDAMQGGETFFIATGIVEGREMVLGFASDYPIADVTHGTSVYVRGIAARRGIGSALLRRAEAHAVAAGARVVEIAASLAGVGFYRANGYTEVRHGEARLMSGHPIACVFMRKELAQNDPGR